MNYWGKDITYDRLDGDLIKFAKEGVFDVIVHGCNCKKVMGAGIAKQIAKEFPEVKLADKITSNNKLGQIDVVDLSNSELKVVNAYTQLNWGKANTSNDTQRMRYSAISRCMRAINREFKGLHIGLPLIGCGLAGGDWDFVSGIIKEALIDCEYTVVHYK